MCGDTLCSFIFKTGTLKTRCKHFVQGQNFLIGGQHCTTMRPNTRICSSYRLYWIVFPEVPIIIFLRRAGGMVDVMLGACIISWEPSGGSKLGLFPLKIQNLAESLHFQTNGPSISSAVLVSLSPELQQFILSRSKLSPLWVWERCNILIAQVGGKDLGSNSEFYRLSTTGLPSHMHLAFRNNCYLQLVSISMVL